MTLPPSSLGRQGIATMQQTKSSHETADQTAEIRAECDVSTFEIWLDVDLVNPDVSMFPSCLPISWKLGNGGLMNFHWSSAKTQKLVLWC